MFCPNCGASMPDGSSFCGSCGTRIETAQDAGAVHVKPASEAVNEPAGGAAQPTEQMQGGAQQPGPEKKSGLKISPKLLAIAAVAVVAVVVIVIVSGLLSGGGSGGGAYVYLADGEYMLLTSLKEGEEIDIASSRDSDVAYNLVRFSKDGTYIYYYSKYDENSGTGTLSRAQFGKLKQDSDKNDNYIELIASNVKLGFSMQDDGTIVYQTGGDDLYYYDGSNDPVQIAKDIEFYYSDGESRLIYEKEEVDICSLYSIDLEDPDTATRLVSDYSELAYYRILDSIIYTKYGEGDEDSSYYVVDLEGTVTKLGSGVSIYQYNYDDEIDFYYTVSGETELSLYDYVNDDYAEQDADIVEPDLEDYTIPTYSYYKLDSGSDISGYDEIYTSCTVTSNFYSSGWFYRSLEYAAENDDKHAADYQAFVDKYLDQEDEDGYIVVTDEVEADLILLAQTCGEGYDNEWLEMCFYREQTGTSYDRDAYNEDCAVYEEAADRIAMREALQDPENAYEVKTLYSWSEGTSAVAAENVLSIRSNSMSFVYNTVDMITEKMELEQLSYAGEVEELFSLDYEAANYVLMNGSASPYQLSENAAAVYADALEEGYYAYFYETDSALYLISYPGIYLASTEGSEISSLSLISDDASLSGVSECTIYYFEGVYSDSSGHSFGDLYSHDGETSTLLARDIMQYNYILYEDGVILCYTDIAGSGDNARGELTMIDAKGNVSIVADNVTQFVRVDEDTILYIANYGALYVYDGEDETKLDSGVDYIWAMESEDVEIGYLDMDS